MADEKIVTNVVATSDFSGLIADVQRTTSALSKLQAELSLSNKALAAQAGQIQKAFGETLRSTGQFTTHFVTVGSEVENFGKKLDTGKLKLGDYFRTWQNHTKTSGGLIRDLAKQQVALQNAIVQPLGKAADGMMKFNVHVAKGLDETVNKTALARKELQIYNKVIQDGGVQLINWGKNTQWAGRQLTVGLTVPLAAFGAAAAKAFREADQELVRLQKVYGGLSATSAQELAKVRKDVSDTARELSSMYGASYKDTIGLAADIAATGKQGNELLQSTREATRLSILGEVDRQEAMKATLAIQSAFKQNTEELTGSINFLNAVENQTSTSLADLVEAIPKAGPVVKALGGDVQDLALYLTAMREGGINASEGANALKSALASIINPTKVAKEQFASFGIDLEGIVRTNAGNLTETILSIQAALETLDPLKKSQAIEQLFGKFQFARMNALFENLGKQGSQTLQVLDLMKASSQDLANVAGRELSQITESASGQYKRAIETLKADLAGLGDQFLKIGTFFVKVIDGVVKFVTKLPDPIKNLLGLLGGITALAGPLIMLTGVFANFIGYVIKGIGHIRALGKGGEGFKLLTPEILAAEKAGSLIEKTFYSDAQAAKILTAALANLSNEYTILQQKAAAGTVSAQPLISTIAGNVVVEGAERVADPSSRYIGKPYSRDMSHTRPVAAMSTEEKAAQNIFGVVPGPKPVNQRIGKSPQIYMTGDMPRVGGLTEVSGVSTGIVAQEAAKWHSMTAAIAMQSEEEITLLKREIDATGTVTSQLSESYAALLPKMSNITTLAAEESRLIVADLQASKITVDQARAKVIELNRRIEAMMAETTAAVAASQGRVANITTVPLTGQPVVDPVTGKSNMKEMFHKSRTAALVDKIARNLGVRTSGGGYSIETTKPKRFNMGGAVEGFGPNKTTVSGPASVNYDDRMGTVPVGGYVLNQQASLNPANKDLVALAPYTYSQGGETMNALLTPKETVFGPGIQDSPELYAAIEAANNGFSLGGRIRGSKGFYGKLPNMVRAMSRDRDRVRTVSGIQVKGSDTEAFVSQIAQVADKVQREKYYTITRQFANKQTRSRNADPKYWVARASKTLDNTKIEHLNDLYSRWGLPPLPATPRFHDTHFTVSDLLGKGRSLVSRYIVNYSASSNLSANQNKLRPSDLFKRDLIKRDGVNKYEAQLKAAGIPKNQWDEAENNIDQSIKGFFESESNRLGVSLDNLPTIGDRPGRATYTFAQHFIPLIEKELENISKFSTRRADYRNLKLNTILRNVGGPISSGKNYYGVRSLPTSVIDRLTANWPKKRPAYKQGLQYVLGNQDPLHGPLQIGMASNLKRYSGYDPNKYPRESVHYRDEFNRLATPSAFLTGNEQRRGMYATSRYMAGDLDIMDQMEKLGNHPLGPIAAMRAVQKKFSGRLFRGIIAGKTQNALPKHIEQAILRAKETGDWESVFGKEFIMRRSSWSKDKTIADYFAMRGNDPGSILLEAIVRNRNVVPAGDLFPKRVFRAPYGQDYPQGKFGGGLERPEQEAIFGGKFRIVGYKNGAVQIETMAEAREMGGDVSAGKPYLVGEKGPELFVPRNSGGIIPNYVLGGGLSRYGRLRDTVRGNRPLGRQKLDADGNPMPIDPNSGMVSSMAGMAMMMGGQQMPGMAGQAMTFAGLGMQMAPMLKMMKPMLSGMSTFGGLLAKVRTVGVAAFTALRAGLAALMGPVGLVSIGIGVAVAAFLKLKDNATKAGEVNRATFGLTSTALEEVGIKYKTVSERLKEVNEQLELNRAKVRASYEAYTKSGVVGLDLTLKELKDGIANAKKEDKESVGLFDKAKTDQVNKLAASMKAQYVSLGMSVQEATNQIYILIKASNKSSQAVNAISSESFKQIEDRASAARYTVDMLGKVLSNKGLFNAEEFSRGLDNMLNSLDSYKRSLMETTKKQVGISETDALKKTFEQMNKTGSDRIRIEGKSLEALKKQNIELGLMLGKAETLASVFAKYQLSISGMASDIDIAALSPADAVLAAQGARTSMDAAGAVVSETALARSAQKAQNEAKKANEILKAASKQDSSYIDAAIKNKQKLINKLEEERAARLKILELQEKSANFETDIQQAQIRYQEALAAGDMARAAQEQLNIQQLSGDRQRELARQSINDKADAERKKLEAEIEKLQAQKDAQAKALVNAQNTATKKEEDAVAAAALLEELKAAITNFGGDTKDDIQQFKTYILDLRSKGRGSAVNDLFARFAPGAKGESSYQILLENLKKQFKTELKDPKYDKFDSAVKKFQEAVDKFAGLGDGSYAKPLSAGTGEAAVGIKNINWGNQTVGFGLSDREKVKKFAQKKGYEPGTQFTLTNATGEILQFLVLPDGNIQLQKRTMPTGKAMGGLISGPGTGTSDSIPAMVTPGFASGGIPIRVSNGEYILSKKAVDGLGGPSMVDGLHKSARSGKSQLNAYQRFMLGMADNAGPIDKMFGIDSISRLLSGTGSKGDLLGSVLGVLGGGSGKAVSGAAKNIKEARAFTHYAHNPIQLLQPSIGKVTSGMANYGPGTYGSATDKFMGDTFGTVAHKLSLSPLAWIKTALGRGTITDDLIAKEAANFAKKTGKDAPQHLTDEFASFLSKRGYSGYKTEDILTNWKVGYPGFGLRNSLGKVPFGKPVIQAPYPELPEMPGVLFANGGLINNGMPSYNIPNNSVSVANKPFNSYASGGLVNNYGGFNIHASKDMDEKALAKYIMSEIESATAKTYTSKGSPGMRLI